MRDRSAARQDYEAELCALSLRAETLVASGFGVEEIARTLVFERNAIKRRYWAGDDSDTVALMETRNLAKFGDPIGPSADQLYMRYGDWTPSSPPRRGRRCSPVEPAVDFAYKRLCV